MLLGVLSSLSIGWRAFLSWSGEAGAASNALFMGQAISPASSSVDFHSHNDYVHQTPLYDAFRHGVPSIEADIWLVEGQLLVGHNWSDLHPSKTLASLYLDPLLVLINAHNSSGSVLERGLPALAHMPLQLLIDIKTDGPSTFPYLYSALEPLRSAGLLSTYHPNTPRITQSLLTIIGTGNTPLDSIVSLGSNATHPRDVFLDAELTNLPDGVDHTVAPLASTSFMHAIGFKHWLPFLARRRIRGLVAEAHKRGIQARFWSVPRWPGPMRMHIQSMLLSEGVDWLNVDTWREVRWLRRRMGRPAW